MRIFLVLVAAAALSSGAHGADVKPAPAPSNSKKADCNNHRVSRAATEKAIGARPLGHEPDAQHIQAVVRTIDGCSRPIVLSENRGLHPR